MKRLFAILLFFPAVMSAALPAHASSPQAELRGKLSPGRWKEYSLRCGSEAVIVGGDNGFAVARDIEVPEIVMLTGVVGEGDEKWQFSAPVLLKPGIVTTFDLLFTDRVAELLFPEDDADNTALAVYRDFSLGRSRALWTDPPAAADAARELAEYAAEAARLTAENTLSPEVAEYLALWAAVDYLDGCSALEHIHSHSADKAALPVWRNLPGLPGILDSRWATLLFSVPGHVGRYIADSVTGPEQQLEMLRDGFRSPALVDAVAANIIEGFITRYDYSDYDRGLERLESMAAGMSGRDEYLARFRSKRFSVVGSTLPDAPLKDRQGNEVKLSDFAGKYVYIDLWASWCAPCCAEVPHLQRLERELQNDLVVFVSVSIDEDGAAWRNKMDELGMHGNQFIAADDTLATMLNVSGIPHFLLYGPDGRMLEYKAPRPSSGGRLKNLLEGLR